MLTDRVRAVGTVWLGQTTGCAQCHDHKFDPITTRDFYALGAFFADITEPIVGRREPGMVVATAEQEAQLKAMDKHIASLTAKLEAPSAELDAAQREWEQRSMPLQGKVQWTSLRPIEAKSDKSEKLAIGQNSAFPPVPIGTAYPAPNANTVLPSLASS